MIVLISFITAMIIWRMLSGNNNYNIYSEKSIIILALFLIFIMSITRSSVNNVEGFGNTSQFNTEAVQTIASVYNSGGQSISNMNITQKLNSQNVSDFKGGDGEHGGTHLPFADGKNYISGNENWIRGDAFIKSKAGNTLKFSSGWSAYPDDKNNASEISNDTGQFKSLMIAGNKSAGGNRKVSLWDDVKISGNLEGGYQLRNRAKFIRIGNNKHKLWSDYWTPIELEAYDHSGNNIAKGKVVKKISGNPYGNYNINNIVNGKIFNSDKERHDNHLHGYHGHVGKHELEIDLGAEYDIAEIIIYNRWNSDADQRLDGTHIQLLDKDKNQRRLIHTGLWHRQYSKEYLL